MCTITWKHFKKEEERNSNRNGGDNGDGSEEGEDKKKEKNELVDNSVVDLSVSGMFGSRPKAAWAGMTKLPTGLNHTPRSINYRASISGQSLKIG